MIKTLGMTITPTRKTMTSPSVQTASKSQRLSNFSVASLLADTSPRSQPSDLFLESKLCQSSPSPTSKNDSSSTKIENERSQTPQSCIESEDEYDSQQEDSIVDIEDVNNENNTLLGVEKPCMIGNLNGHTPIRPTPFSALAAAAAAWSGIGGTIQWSNSRQITPFGPPGIFNTQAFGSTQLNAGKIRN